MKYNLKKKTFLNTPSIASGALSSLCPGPPSPLGPSL